MQLLLTFSILLHQHSQSKQCILFLVYINYLEEEVTGKILKFADDTKLFRKTKEIGDEQNVQDDIDEVVKWSEKLQMLFNFGKCKCLHTGPGNTSMNYEMGGTILSKTVKEKDLGVTMNANMKVSEQCRIAASKGNQVLGMIRRNITCKDKSLIVPLYQRRSQDFCLGGATRYIFRHLREPTAFSGGGGVVAEFFRDLHYRDHIQWGGGGSTRNVPSSPLPGSDSVGGG